VQSNRIFRELLARYAASEQAGLVVDIHSGMGKFGDCLLLTTKDGAPGCWPKALQCC
jgi:Protein of unknown function (DUF2817)